MNVLAFDPYSDDQPPLAAKVAKVAKVAEIRGFSEAKLQGDAAKAAKEDEGALAALAGRPGTLAPGNPQKTTTLAVLAGLAASRGETLKSDAAITVPCARCGTPSRPFAEVVNPEGWICDACLPADTNDEAYEGEERAAIQCEGNPAAEVPHLMPVSWADPTILPTPGARCRCCNGRSWWTETTQPRGWRCSRCHPPSGITPENYRTAP